MIYLTFETILPHTQIGLEVEMSFESVGYDCCRAKLST